VFSAKMGSAISQGKSQMHRSIVGTCTQQQQLEAILEVQSFKDGGLQSPLPDKLRFCGGDEFGAKL
jgi:hypothetical protein